MNTKIMPVSDLRRETSAVLRKIQEDGDIVYITQHGRPTAVILNYKQYEAMVTQAQSQGWPRDYFAQTYGALANSPLIRPTQGEFEKRETVQ